jgi:hypothetical protein
VNRYGVVILFVVLGSLAGCGQHHSRSYQRFVLIGNTGGEVGKTAGPWDEYRLPRYAALALDTKTGSLCVTYQFKLDIDHPEWKDREIQTCKSLYEKDPD